MRYDCDGYDGSPYDGSGTVEIILSGTGQTQISGYGDLVVGAVLLSGSGQMEVSGTGALKEVIYLSGTGQIRVSGTGEVSITALLSGVGQNETSGTGSLQNPVYLSGTGQIQVSGTGELYIYAEITFTFGGTLAAGKTIVIDTNDFTVVNDGVNAIASMTGDFPEIYPGTNQVIYTDSLGSRTVTIVIVKKDRSV